MNNIPSVHMINPQKTKIDVMRDWSIVLSQRTKATDSDTIRMVKRMVDITIKMI